MDHEHDPLHPHDHPHADDPPDDEEGGTEAPGAGVSALGGAAIGMGVGGPFAALAGEGVVGAADAAGVGDQAEEAVEDDTPERPS